MTAWPEAGSELAELRTALDQLRVVFETHGCGPPVFEHTVLLTDADGRVVYVTRGACRMLGVPSETMLSARLAEVLAGFAVEGAEPERVCTLTVPRDDGSAATIRKRTLALVRDGCAVGAMHTFQDTSVLTQHARELADKSRELDEARARLTRAQHLKALGELAAEVAHEFGNLLQAVGLQTAAIRRHPELPPAIGDALGSIRQAVELGQELTRRLLTFARDESGAETKLLDVGRVLRELVQLLEPRLNKAGVPLRVTLDLPALPELRADETKLTEAFLNLFLNALDAMPDGGMLDVSAAERSGEIRIAVRDTGKGMGPEEVQRAFDPFFTTKPGGTGLGLSTVYGVVRGHGGSVFIESEPGHGTTVFVSLPTAVPPIVMPVPAVGHRRESGRVLVVDDHPTVRTATSELLASQGYDVESAGTVAEALAALESHDFSVVVTDVGLPDRPGWEVARAAKARHPETVVVLVSGWGGHFSAEEARARGVDVVFEKPVAPDVLLSAIERRESAA